MKPRVLLFIDWFLPGYKAGGPVTSIANMVEHLRLEVDFFIITRDTDYCESTPYPSIISNLWVPYKEGVSIFYFSKESLSISNLKKIATDADCEHWYINGIYSFYFSILPLFLARIERIKRITVASRGMLSSHSLSVKPFKKKVLLYLFKILGVYRSVYFHATNQLEAIEIQKQIGPSKGILIAPNLSKLAFTSNLKAQFKKDRFLRLLGLSRISPEKNTLGALEILTHINHPVQLDWYGQVYDHYYFGKCEELLHRLPHNVKINFHSSISPEKIPSVLENSHFFFSPTLGENFGHSILESLLAGVPVIISDQTPWRGLEEKGIGWDIPLSNPERFIQAIETAASMEQEEYNKMSQAAYDFAKDFTMNPEVLEANRKLFRI